MVTDFRAEGEGFSKGPGHTPPDNSLDFNSYSPLPSGRRGGLMISPLIPGSSGPGSSTGRGTLCCVLGQDT